VASILRERAIDVTPQELWARLRDWGALHELASGFVVDTKLDDGDRIVTFANGSVLREVLVSLDDQERRLAWSIVDGPYTHHNGSARVIDENGRARFQWRTDLLPDEAADRTAAMMDQGIEAIKTTLESAPAAVGR
jgi:hypothetical protein